MNNNIVLLYMFIKGLYSLFKQQVISYVYEIEDQGSSSYVSMDEMEMDLLSKSRTILNNSSEHRGSNLDVKRIKRLYNIMKKQTILVCIALGMSMVFWVSCIIAANLGLVLVSD